MGTLKLLNGVVAQPTHIFIYPKNARYNKGGGKIKVSVKTVEKRERAREEPSRGGPPPRKLNETKRNETERNETKRNESRETRTQESGAWRGCNDSCCTPAATMSNGALFIPSSHRLYARLTGGGARGRVGRGGHVSKRFIIESVEGRRRVVAVSPERTGDR